MVAEKFWMAPEVLRNTGLRSQEADVYGFGIILHEIITREGPYDDSELQPQGKL